jgi:hypothetical protein
VRGLYEPGPAEPDSGGTRVLDDLLAKAAMAGREALGQVNLRQLAEKADPKEPASRFSPEGEPVCAVGFSRKF